ncbi:MAG: hypothetical protein ACI9OJ_005389, partial [Myxococcota bacterium]
MKLKLSLKVLLLTTVVSSAHAQSFQSLSGDVTLTPADRWLTVRAAPGVSLEATLESVVGAHTLVSVSEFRNTALVTLQSELAIETAVRDLNAHPD